MAQRFGRDIALLLHERDTRGVSGQRHAPGALCPRENLGTHFAGVWVGPGPVWTGGKSRPHRDSIPTVQAVVSRYTD